jgi:hypothetical protein
VQRITAFISTMIEFVSFWLQTAVGPAVLTSNPKWVEVLSSACSNSIVQRFLLNYLFRSSAPSTFVEWLALNGEEG